MTTGLLVLEAYLSLATVRYDVLRAIAMMLAWVLDLSESGVVVTVVTSPETSNRAVSPPQSVQLVLIVVLVCTVGYLYFDRLYEARDGDPAHTGAPEISAQSIAALTHWSLGDAEAAYEELQLAVEKKSRRRGCWKTPT